MKTCLRLLVFFSFFSLSGLFVSCEPDDTFDTDPTDTRNEFVGLWRFTENGYKNGLSQSYIVTISLDPDNSSQVILENFGNPGDTDNSVTAIVTSNQIVVSSQTMKNGWVVEGSGKRTTVIGKMDWNYSIEAGGDKEYYTATATKQ